MFKNVFFPKDNLFSSLQHKSWNVHAELRRFKNSTFRAYSLCSPLWIQWLWWIPDDHLLSNLNNQQDDMGERNGESDDYFLFFPSFAFLWRCTCGWPHLHFRNEYVLGKSVLRTTSSSAWFFLILTVSFPQKTFRVIAKDVAHCFDFSQ